MRSLAAAFSACLLVGFASDTQAQAAKTGPLRVGAARVDVTPGPGDLPKHYLGVLDRVYSRAIVIDNGTTTAALVTVDVIMLSNAVADRVNERIASELGIPVQHIVLAGTGTHSAPMGSGPPPPGAAPAPNVAFEDKIVDSVRQAKDRLQPARLTYGTGVSYINVNRDNIDPKTRGWWEGPNYDGVSDKSVGVLTFVSPTGAPIAVYYNYGVFNVIAGTLDLVSGDITGETSRYIEEFYDDTVVAVLSLGAHGDQNPIFFQQTYDLREIRIKEYAKRGEDISNAMPPGGQGLDRQDPTVKRLMDQQKQMAVSMGQFLGEEVLRVMRGIERTSTTAPILAGQKMVTCPGRERTNTGRGGIAGTYKDGPDVSVRLSLLILDDIAIGGVSGEVYNLIAQRFKRESPMARTMMATITNGRATTGYIPNDAAFGYQVFEVLSSRLQPGCAESAIVNGLLDLMAEAKSPSPSPSQ